MCCNCRYFFIFSIFFLGADEGLVPFSKSFIEGYSFNPESRFSREYHPYLLQKTQDSLSKLENYLKERQFTLAQRLLIMGYEQNAIPTYFNCLSNKHLEDEAVTKTESGWEFAPGNVFGFLTGYLFKTVSPQQSLVEHIGRDTVELFNNGTEILQKHSFGQWYDTILSYQAGMEKHIRESNIKQIFNYTMGFIKSIYESECKNVQGSHFATQDILFSLYYTKHLAENDISIHKLFVGPDITYPIEVTERQPVEVTVNAQAFVKRFLDEVKPINGQKTAYIFWSFVDGVGKSTLLGNICNWLKYGTDFEQYEHVSNASSQRATLYEVNDKVIIADLPAQISHYCAKPDGHVYIDIGFYKNFTPKDLQAFQQYLIEHFQEIFINFEQKKEEITIDTVVKTPEDQFIKNVVTLQAETFWRPFCCNGYHMVVNSRDPRQMRVLVSFDEVHSQGLKIKEPELMIFDKGLSIPMSYDHFMKDLADQLAKAGVEQVVFVDFLSMYPRASRETVRINYLLQQLKTFYQDEFLLEKSIYRSFSHYHELYPLFFEHKDQFERSLFLESLLRWVIHDAIMQASKEDLIALTTDQVFKRLRLKIDDLYRNHKDQLNEILCLLRKRIEQEEQTIKYYEFSKFYEAVSRFSVDRFAQLSEMVRSLAAQMHPDATVRELWIQLGEEIKEFSNDMRTATLENDLKLEVIRPLTSYDLDQSLIDAIVKEARAKWYSHLTGLVLPELIESYKNAFLIKKYKGVYYLLRYRHNKMSEEAPALMEEFRQFGLSSKRNSKKSSYVRRWLENFKKFEYIERYGNEAASLFVPITALVNYLDENRAWNTFCLENRSKKNPKLTMLSAETIGLVIQALATLHMNLKGPEDELMVRYGSQEDFVAAVRLFEQVMFPKYLNLPVKGGLFANYGEIVPLVGEFKKKG